MSLSSQRLIIETKQMAINDRLGLPVLMGNDDMKPPVNEAYAEFWIIGGKSQAIGGVAEGVIVKRTPGIVQLNLFVPKGKGTLKTSQAMDIFTSAWEYARFTDAEGCRYKFEGSETMTPSTKDGWYCTVGRIVFTRDDFQRIPISQSQ